MVCEIVNKYKVRRNLDLTSHIEIRLLNIFWSIFVFFLMVTWIRAVIGVISDVFRSPDLGGVSKGIWVLFIIVIPWLGVLSYLIIRGKGMQEQNMQAVVEDGERQRAYIQSIESALKASMAEEVPMPFAERQKRYLI